MMTRYDLIGTKWARAPHENGLYITGIANDGRFGVVFPSGQQLTMSLAEMTAMGYWMVEQAPLPSLTELAEQMRSAGLLEPHVAPVEKQAKCEPGCTPAAPCFAVKVCPAWAEEECEQSDWAEHHGEGLTYKAANVWWYPGGNPWSPPELRCAREWGCGLVRAR